MNRFGVKPSKPKILFGVMPEGKSKTYKFLLIGETDQCKLDLLTKIAGDNNLWEGLYSN